MLEKSTSEISIQPAINPYEQEALALLVEAKKKLSKGFFGTLFGFTPKVDEAAEIYYRAGNLYKASKNWKKAAEMFQQAGNLCLQCKNIIDAASYYTSAALCFKKVDEKASVDCHKRAIEIYTGLGKFTTAAKYHVCIAETLEKLPGEIQGAIEHFEKAAEYYLEEDSVSFGNKYLLKVADHSATCKNYEKAIEIYEKVAKHCIGNPLLKYSTKEHFFKAILCHLNVDLLNAVHALDQYSSQSPSFQDSREYMFLRNLLILIENEDIDGFASAVQDYDSVSKLSDWTTSMLLRIKKSLAIGTDLR